MDAESSINPLMMVDYVFEHLSRISKQAYEAYHSEVCDQEKVYVLYKTFLLIYKDLRSKKDFKEIDPKDNPVKRSAYHAHTTLEIIEPELEKRYLEHQKLLVYEQASRLASRLTLNSSIKFPKNKKFSDIHDSQCQVSISPSQSNKSN